MPIDMSFETYSELADRKNALEAFTREMADNFSNWMDPLHEWTDDYDFGPGIFSPSLEALALKIAHDGESGFCYQARAWLLHNSKHQWQGFIPKGEYQLPDDVIADMKAMDVNEEDEDDEEAESS